LKKVALLFSFECCTSSPFPLPPLTLTYCKLAIFF